MADARDGLSAPGEEGGNSRIAGELGQIGGIGKLRPVALGIDEAEEAQMLTGIGAELVPRPRRNPDEVVALHCADRAADQAMAGAAQNHHAMHMGVPFERRIAAGRDLEIAQFAGEFGIGETAPAG